jgi:hypothetical protein
MNNFLAFVSTVIACLPSLVAHGSDRSEFRVVLHDFSITLTNTTAGPLGETTILLGPKLCSPGTLGPKVAVTYHNWVSAIGANAVVQWQDARNLKRKALVSLVGVYEPGFDGTLTFSITDTNVSVTFQKIYRYPDRDYPERELLSAGRTCAACQSMARRRS